MFMLLLIKVRPHANDMAIQQDVRAMVAAERSAHHKSEKKCFYRNCTRRAHYTSTAATVTLQNNAVLTMRARLGRQACIAHAFAMVRYLHAILLIVVDGVW
jgi:predicted metal-dependent hydrolase